MKVLLLDDDPEIRLLLAALLETRGHDVVEFSTAEEAWIAYQAERFALLVVDWMLPGKSGLDLVRDIRSLPGSDQTVILMSTALGDPDHLSLALAAGVDDFIPKPIQPAMMKIRLAIAEQRVQNRAARARAERDLEEIREKEIQIGAAIQHALLLGQAPRTLPRIEIASHYQAARKVGGDFYDFFDFPAQGSVDLLIGDVMGKGVPAALLGAAAKGQFTRTLSRLLAEGGCGERDSLPDPGEIVAQVHQELSGQLLALQTFFTLLYLRLDLVRSQAWFVDCGHTGLIHVSAREGVARMLHGTNLPIGIADHEEFHPARIEMGPEDRFLLFSDGVTEARDLNHNLLGDEPLLSLMQEGLRDPPDVLIHRICERVERFSGTPSPADDITLVAVRVRA